MIEIVRFFQAIEISRFENIRLEVRSNEDSCFLSFDSVSNFFVEVLD